MKIRNLILLAFGLLPFFAAAQTATFDRVRVRQGLTIRAEKADSIIRAVTALSNHTSIPTAKAVWDAIAAIVAASKYQTLRDDGSNMTQQPAANFVSTGTVAFTLTNDAGNTETEVSAAVPAGGITSTELAASSVNSSKIRDTTIVAGDIKNATITSAKLANSGVSAGTYPSTNSLIPQFTVNAQGQITSVSQISAADVSSTNEGILGVSANGSNDAALTTNTSTGNSVVFAGGAGIAVTESTSSNGGTITISGTVTASGPDSTFAKSPSGTYSGKRITDNVYRTGKVSVGTTDTTAVLNLRETTATSDLNGALQIRGRTNGDSVNIFIRLRSSAQDSTEDFVIGAINSGSISAAGDNTSWYDGHNVYPGGSRINSTKSALFRFSEDNFTNAMPLVGSVPTYEFHYAFVPKNSAGNVQSRFFSTALDHLGRVSDLGLVSDLFTIKRFGQPYGFRPTNATNWVTANFYDKKWMWGDSLTQEFSKNNVPMLKQSNAAGSSLVTALTVDASDRVLLGGANESNVAAFNSLQITNSGLLWNENGSITVGKSGLSNDVIIRGGGGDRHLTFKNSSGGNEWVFGVSGNDLFMRSETGGNYPWWVDKRGPDYTWRSTQTGDIGLGLYAPAAKLDILTSGGVTAPLFRMRNSAGYSTMYRTTALPEGAISADPGDIALSAIGGVGRMWMKESGTGNTGWKEFLTPSNGITGSGESNRVTLWSGTQGLTSDADFTYNGDAAVLTRTYTNTRDMPLVLSGNVPGLNFRTSGASFSLFSGYYNNNTLSVFHGAGTGNPSTNIANFTSDGRVGIGTSTPSALLHVVGNTLTEGRATVQSTGTNAALYLSNATASTGKEWYLNSVNAGDLVIGNPTAADAITINGTTGATTIGGPLTLNTAAGTATTLTGRTSSGVFTDVGIGSGLSLSGGTLSVTGGAGNYQTLRDDGTDKTQRAAANFVSSATVAAVLTDDAGNGETEISLSVPNGSINDDHLAATGVTAGSYTNASVTVDADGRVTAVANGSAPTGTVLQNGNSFAAGMVIGTNDANTLSLETNNVVRAVYTGGASTGGALTHTDVTANTNTVESIVTRVVNSSGTAAAGFGQRQLAQLESSTTNAQDAAAMDVLWTTATHASRTADVVFSNVNNATSLAETFRIAGNGNLTSTSLITNTNTAADVLTIRANSTGTPANNFGGSILFQGESSTTNNQNLVRLSSYWGTATHASRASNLGIQLVTAGSPTPVEGFTFTNANNGTLSIGTLGGTRCAYRSDGFTSDGAVFLLSGAGSSIFVGGGISEPRLKSTIEIELTPEHATSTANYVVVGKSATATNTSGDKRTMEFQQAYVASSGTGTLTSLKFANTVNQTSTASGVIRAIQIAPTLTSVTGTYRAVDIDANHANAKGVYQSGTSTTNNFAGNTAFGSTSTPAQSADFYGNIRLRALRMEDYATLTGTGTVTASTTISDNLYKPGSTQATLTLNLPGSPTDMQICSVGFGNIVTTLTVSGNGNTLNGTAPTTAAVGDSFAYKFYSGTGWIKIK